MLLKQSPDTAGMNTRTNRFERVGAERGGAACDLPEGVGLGPYLTGDSRWRSASRRLRSADRLRPLLVGERVREPERLCLALLSAD